MFLTNIFRKSKILFTYMRFFDFRGIKNRFKGGIIRQSSLKNKDIQNNNKICIMTTHHNLFIANNLYERLEYHGFFVAINIGELKKFDYDYYFVICPQAFENLPSLDRVICYQLEQTISTRWFTDNYYNILKNSLAILDYSEKNIEFLSNKISSKKLYYLPVCPSITYDNTQKIFKKRYDILFYGDYRSSLRRRTMLDILSKYYRVCKVEGIYGNAMKCLIKSSRLVINIHYYENALLETTRINECLSLGVPVVSESSRDQDLYSELNEVVTYFKDGDTLSMLVMVKEALNCTEDLSTLAKCYTKNREFSFETDFDSFLHRIGLLSINK